MSGEHKKPFTLTAIYTLSAGPTPLTISYDLHANFLGLPDDPSKPQYILTLGHDSVSFGDFRLSQEKWLEPVGLSGAIYGQANIQNKRRFLLASGFSGSSYGSHSLRNINQTIQLIGFSNQAFTNPKVYNLKQILNLNSRGINSASYGRPFVQGGVKTVKVSGLNASTFGTTKLINTRADQYAKPSGIAPPAITGPNVSPRMLRPTGIKSDSFGQPFLQRNPNLKGFVNTSYGVAWISHSPRYLTPSIISAFESGYPKVFDPTQKIFFNGTTTVIVGGIFGDIAIRNTRRIINTQGIFSQQFSDWAVVESTRRSVESKSFNAQLFGNGFIRNKTPSIAPNGINSISGLNTIGIGYRIRTVKPNDFYQPKFGNHTLTKSPELKPNGINALAMGNVFISNRVRNIYAGLGRETLVFGETITWHYSRKLNPAGIKSDAYGSPRIEHDRRLLLAQGLNQAQYGNNTWVSFAKRHVQPISIIYPNMPIHRVGGTQRINLLGYFATLFGTRIVPESQSIYPQGFINPFGITVFDLWKRYIKPNGFLTTGQEAGHRFGTAKFWNLRQYIIQFYDGDSGLVPPKWYGWTNIENKNKTIGVIGSNCTRIGAPYIENNARILIPNRLNALTVGKVMIADRVRSLRLQGVEAPYISSWAAIYNAAPVISNKGFKSEDFGVCNILNTRRSFNRIGNFESLEMGRPMIADRIRTLKFEQRYTIAPPYIPIHRIDLHTRYIEEVGRFDDHQAFGNPSLSIHWNIITPRWTLRDAYGTATIKNLTPELAARGRNSEEFGEPSIRTQWRDLLHLGSETVVWGRSEIAFRDRKFSMIGFSQSVVPRHTVIKTGVPPYYPQYIWLDAVEIDGKQNDGHGISLPKYQVSVPDVKTNVIFPKGFIASLYGSHYTQSNGILVHPGLQELTIGNHFVGLKNRNVTVPSLGDSMIVSKPRLSPHTIYAVMESPAQARQNHEPRDLHFVNSDYGNRQPGEVFGRTTITLQHRKLSVGLGNQSGLGYGHKIELRKRYINLKDFGFRSQRIGFHVVGPFDQNVMQFDSNDMQSFGRPTLSIPYGGAFFIKPNGLNSPALNRPIVDFFNRTIKAVGSNHLQMGTRKGSDTPFMWQGLRVGELVKGNYGGFDNQRFGQAWISLKIRGLVAQGFESFVMEYDYTQFDKRMRVIRKELPKPKIFITPVGVDALCVAVPNIKPAAHYIRPDGNADQYRKGAF